MFKVNGNTIYLTRADTALLEISLHDDQGEPYLPQTGDHIYFRVKSDAQSQRLIIEKQVDIESMTLELVPIDTEKLSFKTYKYEIELVTSDGRHYTVIDDADFNIGIELENHYDTNTNGGN